MLRRLTPARLAGAGLLLLLAVVVGLWLVPSDTYIFLPDKAHPVEPLVTVQGGRAPRDGGGIYFVDIFVRRATLLERLFPGIREGSTLVPASAVRPPGVSDAARRREDLREMTRSQLVAAAVALRALGKKVLVHPQGARIDQVIQDAPAAGKLQASDIVLAVDGHPVRTPAALRRELARKPPGSTMTLRIRRDDELRNVTLRTIADPHRPGRAVIGVFVSEAADIELPIKVKIRAGDIGGPSAGLAFALDVLEELGRDVDHGHKIAATGQIELDGTVSPIGGVRQKTIGVRRSGVDVFLVPAGENADEAKRYADGVRIIPVKSFQQALRALATLPRAA
jgi:PDZ domain-containing protein